MAPNPNTRWPSPTRSRRSKTGPEHQYQWPSEERILSSIAAISDRRTRVADMRRRYDIAATDFDDILLNVPGVVKQNDKRAWCEDPDALVAAYATAEGL
jgi:hypothetical protein